MTDRCDRAAWRACESVAPLDPVDPRPGCGTAPDWRDPS